MTRRRAALAAGIPIALLLAGEIVSRLPDRDPERARQIASEAARRVEEVWRARVDGLMRLAVATRDGTHPQNPRSVGPIEGTGILDADGRWIDWSGTPSEIDGTAPGAFRLVRRGRRSSLVARSTGDADGKTGMASAALGDGSGGPRSWNPLAEVVGTAGSLRLAWGEPHGSNGAATLFHPELEEELPGSAATARVALRLPDGGRVGTAIVEPIGPQGRRGPWRSVFRAWAILAAVVAAGTLPWRRWTASGRGLVAALATVAGARALLAIADAPDRLLPRELGTASLFGSVAFGGLLASPASLLTTTIACVAAAAAWRRFVLAGAGSRPRLTRGAALAAAIAGSAAAIAFARDVARDTRVPLLGLESAWRTAAGGVLVLGLACAAYAAAECVAAARDAWRSRPAPSERARRRWTAVALVPVVAAATWAYAHERQRGDLARLRAEYVPQVRQQGPLRRVALVAAVRDAAASPESRRTLEDPSYAGGAYACWIAGDLFHQGFASSIDIQDAEGEVRSHFAFGATAVRDAPWASPPDDEPAVREERVPLGAATQRLLHAEMAVRLKGRIVGRVVGHVVDEPDNLPFLPWIAPYLAALQPGPRTPLPTGREPDYVRYDRDGNVLVNTLAQPPPLDPRIRGAAAGGETLTVLAGDERFLGAAIADADGTHLVLARRGNWLDLEVGFVRLLLPALAILGFVSAISSLRRAGGLTGLVGLLRGSFRRKLLASVLAASVVPLVIFSLFLRGYLERRAEAGLNETAAGVVGVVERLVEDYAAVARDDAQTAAPPNDEVLGWLRRVVGQEIHLYENGVLAATSKPELFDSGLLAVRLPGEIARDLLHGGIPFRLRRESLGATTLPVAYGRVDLPGPGGIAVVGVPLVLQQRDIVRATERAEGMLLLTTVLLAGTLAIVAVLLSRAVARPVREVVDGTARLAAGDEATRLETTSTDELGRLVAAFNAMAEALAAQRADLVRRRDYIEALLRHATTGVVSIDAGGRVVTFNPAAETLLAPAGVRLEPGEALADLLDRRGGLEPLRREVVAPLPSETTPAEIDLPDALRPRRLRVVRVALPDPLGAPPGILLLLDDVTELMRSNQLAAWAEMARAIAHEIKNPLTPIQLSAEHLGRLLQDRGGEPPEAVRDCLATILKQVRELREIAAEFSAYAKLPALSPVSSDPSAFVREVLAPYRAAPPPGVAIRERYEPTPAVAIDRRVLGRAIVNLVENALQALQETAGERVLSVAVTPSPEGGCVIAIEDSGEGLSPAVHARLFEPYFSTKTAGTGLGLAIVRRAAEAHGGRIEVSPPDGEGARFAIVLPRSAADPGL